MIQLNKSFLYADEVKKIPVSLSKLTYGFASEFANDIENDIKRESLLKKTLTIRTPVNEFIVVMLMEISPTSNNQIIKSMKTSPPGVDGVSLDIDELSSYWVYIISKDYVDGFIGEDNSIIPVGSSGIKRSFTYSTVSELSISPIYVQDNPENSSSWYNYDGSYQGELKWELTDAERKMFENSDNVYVVYLRSTLATMKDIMVSNGVGSLGVEDEFNAFAVGQVGYNARRHYVNAVKSVNEIFQYVQDLKQSETHSTYQEIRDFVDELETGDYFLPSQFTWNRDMAHEWVEAKILLDHTHSHGGFVTWWWNDDADLPDDRAREWISEINFRTSDRAYVGEQLYNMDYRISRGMFDLLQGGSAISDYGFSNDPPGSDGHINDIDASLAGEKLHDEFRIVRDNINSKMVQFEITGDFNTKIYPSLNDGIISRFLNLRSFILRELDRVDSLIVDLGNFVFAGGDRVVITPTTYYNLRPMAADVDYTRLYVLRVDDMDSNFDTAYADIQEEFPTLTTVLKVGNEYMQVYGHAMEESDTGKYRDISISVVRAYSGSVVEPHTVGEVVNVATIESGNALTPSSIQLAHEATLQNIRYLRGLISSVEDDIWTHVINSHSILYSSIEAIREIIETRNIKINTLMSITDSSVDKSDIDVLYSKGLPESDEKFNILSQSNIYSISQSLKYLDFSFMNSETDIGNYLILVKPKKKIIRVSNFISSNGIVYTPDLDAYESNYFYGWVIEFFKQNGTRVESISQPKIITSAYNNFAGDYRLQISPTIKNGIDFSSSVYAWIWNPNFIPVTIHMDITRHNVETLSYALYAKKELNTDTGIQTIFDYSGNIFDQSIVGKRAIIEEGRAIVNYRDPV